MRWQERIADLTARIHRLGQPVLAAVNGVAYGGGISSSPRARSTRPKRCGSDWCRGCPPTGSLSGDAVAIAETLWAYGRFGGRGAIALTQTPDDANSAAIDVNDISAALLEE